VDSTFESCLKDTGSNPDNAGHCATTVGKLFTPTVPSWPVCLNGKVFAREGRRFESRPVRFQVTVYIGKLLTHMCLC